MASFILITQNTHHLRLGKPTLFSVGTTWVYRSHRAFSKVRWEELKLQHHMFMEYLPVDAVPSQTSKGRTSCCAARGFENEVQTALQRFLRIRPLHTQQAKREQPRKQPPLTPGMLCSYTCTHIHKHPKLSPLFYFYTLLCSTVTRSFT